MEFLLITQSEIMNTMQKLYINYTKDGPSRKTVQNIKKRINQLDEYWQEFSLNHIKLTADCKEKDHAYFSEYHFEKTEAYYQEKRQIFLSDLDLATIGSQQKQYDNPKDYEEENQQHKQQSGNQQNRSVFSNPPPPPEIDESKLQEMMRRQESNIKAFARTIYRIDLDEINEKWEFEDVLASVQSRWAAVDLLHWEIDSKMNGVDELYNQTYADYEKKYHNIKKHINTKMWSMTYRIQSTPQMDIPIFSGNYNQWVSFKDLFCETIHNNRSMSKAQKMQFLKNKVRGEAEKLIQHLHISCENYEICWEILNHRYDNKKLIFSAHINNLLSLPTAQQQSYAHIKKIHDVTNESLNAIKNLGVDIISWDPLVVHILSQKLDSETHAEYLESLKKPKDLPSLKDFQNFLENKFTSLESSRRKPEYQKPVINQASSSKKPYFKSSPGTNSSPKEHIYKSSFIQRHNCPVCNENHGVFRCETFLGSTPEAKRNLITKLKLCKNCLYNHFDKECFSDKRCRHCQQKHNSLVHEAYTTLPKIETPSLGKNKEKNNVNHVSQSEMTQILLATALIKIKAADGSYLTMRALIDQGSQISLISEDATQRLHLTRQNCKGIIYGIGAQGNNCRGAITVTAYSALSDFSFNVDLYIMKNLINSLPNRSFIKPSWSYLEGIPLADPQFYISRSIDILLGADIYATIIKDGIIKGNKSQPVAQQTKLGWILCGSVPSYQCNIVVHNIEDIKKFWNIEDITEKSVSSTEDEYCLQYYKQTTSRQADGRYVVRLPLKQEEVLGSSKSKAIAQFRQLESRFQNDEKLARDYKLFIQEYIELGHMQECTSNESLAYYLPHHCVRRADSTTTSLRVVFNASSKTSNGLSLNDIMHIGPNLQQDLLLLILRWRQYKFAFTADIEKMFRQIKLHPKDQSYQKIIWRDSPDQTLREYTLSTVTYGTKAAPFLAMMTLKQLASDERHLYPEAARVLEDSFYMDDLLNGSHSLKTARKLQSDLIALLKSGGFNLRKWASNKTELLEGVSKASENQSTYEFIDQESTKTLGLRWLPHDDKFTFQLKIEVPIKTSVKITKRSLLSNISKIFDPLGWLSPVTTKLKLLFQSVISTEIKWDDEVSNDITKEWQTISKDLKNINNVKIPRWLKTRKNSEIELHGFCDASTKAYACVIYCKNKDENHKQSTPPILVAAKSRLVPINKNISLPKLELCAAVLLSNLMIKVKQSLCDFEKIKIYGWSDSTAVLGWLQGNPSKWKAFVANRVTKTTETMPSHCWNYVKSSDNPADCASRGIKADQLINHHLWWSGPSWLKSYKNLSYQKQQNFTTDQEIKISEKSCNSVTRGNNVINDIINKTSNMTRATRIVAWLLRVKSRSQCKPKYLTTDEILVARRLIIKHVQLLEFTEDITDLQNKKNVKSKSKLLNLKPFLDETGLLRVGGRISNAHISWEQKHPIIVPHNGRLTDLLVNQAHKSTLHGGARLTLARLRQQYWVIGGNRAVKKRLRLCVTCTKQRPTKLSQLMGDLPESRVNQTRPFYNTGVDFTGFVNVKSSKGRGIKSTKGYVAVFVCMVTKAVHLELVSDLTSSSFVAALRRMSARRGTPRHIYSDNGTNFVGASRTIDKEFTEIRNTLNEEFFDAISEMEITWHFNAPSWPSAGGLWEAAVKSLKHHLCRVLGDQCLTFEEFSTLLTQIEAGLNSRPLCALSEDPEDIDYLTPSHFLSSGPTLHIIETERDERTRWRLTQKIFNDVWKRWKSEYLCQLSSRNKWNQSKPNINIGDVVVIHDTNLPPGKWLLGRIIELHPGKDGYVRVVSVKTKNGVIKRPILKLSILPVSENANQEDSSETFDQNIKNGKSEVKSIRKKLVNFTTLALMLFMLIIAPPVQGNYNISNLTNNQGIYFDKLSNIRIARDEWKLIVYYDVTPYWQGIELFTKYVNHLENMCNKVEDSSHCNIILLQLRHGYSELNYYNDMLLGHRSDHIRKRRGLINGIGNIAHSLFGVLDDQFAQKYEKDIEAIRSNEKHLAKLWKNQTSVIEAEYNLLKRVESAMEKQHKHFNQHLNQLEAKTNRLEKQEHQSVQINELIMSSIIANSIMTNLKNIQETLLDMITNVVYGRINLHVLTPNQLQHELHIIAAQISKDLSLPYEDINTDLPKIYHLLKGKTRMTQQYLIFEIRIPLVSRDTYELFRLISVPRQVGKTMVKIIPIENHVAINIQKESFIPITEYDKLKCMPFDSMTHICLLHSPIYNLKSDDTLCIKDQISNTCKTVIDLCENIWTELNTVNTYLFFYCNQCNIRIICEQEVLSEKLNSGIITLEKDCLIKGESFTIYSHSKPSSETQIQSDILKVEIPTINKVMQLSVPISAVGNETEDIQDQKTQTLLSSINQQINEMKKEDLTTDQITSHDVHHYVTIYLVIIILVIIIVLYVRHRLRHCQQRKRHTPPTDSTTAMDPSPGGNYPLGRLPTAAPRRSLSMTSLQLQRNEDIEESRTHEMEPQDRLSSAPALNKKPTSSYFKGFTS